MRRTILLAWLFLGSLVLAETKIALVRVGEIYRDLEAAKTLSNEISLERGAIMADARLDAYKAVLGELVELRKGLAKAAKVDQTAFTRAQQKFALKRQEATTLQREFEDFRKRRTKEINVRMVTEMNKILSDIHKIARQVGEEKGYDWVIDSTGKTNTGIPFVLYSKDPDDITDAVLERIADPLADASTDSAN